MTPRRWGPRPERGGEPAGFPGAWSFGWSRSSVVAREPIAAPRADRSGDDGGASVTHQANEEMYIVQRQQAKPEDLVRDEEVADVRSRKAAACGTVARAVQRTRIRAELGALDVEAAVAGKGGAVASHPRRRHAIKEIDAAEDTFHQIFRKPDSHQIARTVTRKLVVDNLE